MRALIFLACCCTALAGCGSNSDGDNDATLADTAGNTDSNPADDGVSNPALLPPAPPPDTSVTAPDSEADPATDPDTAADPDPQQQSQPDLEPQPDPQPDPELQPQPDPQPDPEFQPQPDPAPGSDEGGPLAAPDSDLQRLFAGMTRQVGVTLVDLNERLRSGAGLSTQQTDCLGSFDPALGEQLLAVDCLRPLATGDVVIYVERAAFDNTDTCQADLAVNRFDACMLTLARITIPTRFVLPPEPTDGSRPERPQPVTGAELSYNINDEPPLRLTNNPSALTGIFSCSLQVDQRGVELASVASSAPADSLLQGDCATIIRQTADLFDTLQPVNAATAAIAQHR